MQSSGQGNAGEQPMALCTWRHGHGDGGAGNHRESITGNHRESQGITCVQGVLSHGHRARMTEICEASALCGEEK